MFDMKSRGYGRHSAAFGGGADLKEMRRAIGQGEGTVQQDSDSAPQGDSFAKNWVIAFILIFLFMYTVSRILD